jgi:hypothetical protein
MEPETEFAFTDESDAVSADAQWLGSGKPLSEIAGSVQSSCPSPVQLRCCSEECQQ